MGWVDLHQGVLEEFVQSSVWQQNTAFEYLSEYATRLVEAHKEACKEHRAKQKLRGGVSESTVRHRIMLGWTKEEATNTPVGQKRAAAS